MSRRFLFASTPIYRSAVPSRRNANSQISGSFCNSGDANLSVEGCCSMHLSTSFRSPRNRSDAARKAKTFCLTASVTISMSSLCLSEACFRLNPLACTTISTIWRFCRIVSLICWKQSGSVFMISIITSTLSMDVKMADLREALVIFCSSDSSKFWPGGVHEMYVLNKCLQYGLDFPK